MRGSPRPFRRVETATLILRIPRTDWAAVRCGEKREFREAGRWAPPWTRLKLPLPILGYSRSRSAGESSVPDSALFILDECWMEPLGAISTESLAAEGFGDLEELRESREARAAAMSEFRRYWKARHPSTGYRPLSKVFVYRVRPLTEDERAEMGLRLLGLLYDGYL